jgi:hypothetical protein
MKHRWSGWPGAWCLACGKEDGQEIDLAGPPEETHHRYSGIPHTAKPCLGCARNDEPCEPPRVTQP